jgi:MSHA biogenesis protein MshP
MKRHARSAGSALISAIFLIVVLAALGASMVNLSTVQEDTVTKSVLAARVYYGAKAGIDWAVQRTISDPAATPTRCVTGPNPEFPATITLTATGLAGVSVAVTCAQSQHGAGTTAFTYYLTSIATTGTVGTPSYAERRMEATVSNIP